MEQLQLLNAPKELVNQVLGIPTESEEDSDEDEQIPLIEVWCDVAMSVQTFQHCQPELLAGMAGVVWSGVTATEIRATCDMLHIPPNIWPQVIDDVQYMAGISANLKNEPHGRRNVPVPQPRRKK